MHWPFAFKEMVRAAERGAVILDGHQPLPIAIPHPKRMGGWNDSTSLT
jgi:hypothetical protein